MHGIYASEKLLYIFWTYPQGTIEEKIFQRQITKQGLNTVLDFDCGTGASTNPNHGTLSRGNGQGACLPGSRPSGGSASKWAAKFSREELRDLFSLRENTLCDTHDLVQSGRGNGRNEKPGCKAGSDCENSEVSIIKMYS